MRCRPALPTEATRRRADDGETGGRRGADFVGAGSAIGTERGGGPDHLRGGNRARAHAGAGEEGVDAVIDDGLGASGGAGVELVAGWGSTDEAIEWLTPDEAGPPTWFDEAEGGDPGSDGLEAEIFPLLAALVPAVISAAPALISAIGSLVSGPPARPSPRPTPPPRPVPAAAPPVPPIPPRTPPPPVVPKTVPKLPAPPPAPPHPAGPPAVSGDVVTQLTALLPALVALLGSAIAQGSSAPLETDEEGCPGCHEDWVTASETIEAAESGEPGDWPREPESSWDESGRVELTEGGESFSDTVALPDRATINVGVSSTTARGWTSSRPRSSPRSCSPPCSGSRSTASCCGGSPPPRSTPGSSAPSACSIALPALALWTGRGVRQHGPRARPAR